jgi:hypothetical protein
MTKSAARPDECAPRPCRRPASRRRGDPEGADALLRIIVAIGELGTPPSDARH